MTTLCAHLLSIACGLLTATSLLSRVLKHRRYWRNGCVATWAALLVSVPVSSPAAPMSLADAPLFLGNTVQPNIFFMLDDSGSMDWEVLLNAGASGANSGDLDLTPDDTDERREFCIGHNVLAYDPNVRYTPWQGADKAGNPYSNADLMQAGGFTQIRRNPYCPAGDTAGDCNDNTNNETVDLTDTAVLTIAYFPWTDSDSDGQFDAGECAGASTGLSNAITWAQLPSNGTASIPGAEQQRNYANWFSYYRKREYIVKKSVSEFITSSQERMGLSSIHNNQNIGTPIEDMDDITLPVDATAAANKTALLNNLSRVRSTGGTPLRQGLEDVGQYYEGAASGNWESALFNGSPNHDTSETISSRSPILNSTTGGQCQQNFTILMSDGTWNGSAPSVGNEDGNNDTAFDGGVYADTASDTLADVAMHYYERDLRGDLSNNVPVVPGLDDNQAQHMVTFTVAFGLDGTLDPFDTKTPGDPSDTDPADPSFVGWPTPSSGSATTLDDMWHAGYNGRGQYLGAQNPSALNQSLSNALAVIADRTGSAAAVAVNTRTLNTQTRIYQARFTSGEWSGELRALPIDVNGTVGSEVWNAKDQLIAQTASNGWNTNRQIITWDGSSGTAFRWSALNASQQSALNTDPATTGTDGEGAARLDYVRGDSSNEGSGNNYRVRNNGFKLGDIVDSSPVFVGAPPFLPDLESTPHSSYQAAKTSRTEMIYVGANDGMLHGFDAATGDEKLAYVPNMVFSNLNQLTDRGYVHRFYVNATPTAGDAFFGGVWHTMLVGGLGSGGKGYFALNISDPSGVDTPALAFDELNAGNLVQWEFTDAATPDDMGFSYSQPTITKMHDGSWVAIFGNGYNSTNENAVLYIVDIETGAIIKKFDLGGSPGNGLSTPAVVDSDGDFIADYIYAGDLKGNMWKIDVTATNTNSWDVFYSGGGLDRPLFQARDGGGNIQPITERPEVGLHPDGLDGFMLYFGTGKYLEASDKSPSATPVHTFYGIWDENPTSGNLGGGTSAAVLRSDLLAQTLTATTLGGVNVRQVTDNPITWRPGATTPDHLGWQVDLPVTGEMSVSNPVLVGGELARIIFTTLIPEPAASCSFGGTSWLMELNPQNGGRFAQPVFDVNDDGTFDDSDLIGGTGGIPPSGVNPDIGIMPEPVIIRDTANNKIIKGISGSTGMVTTNSQNAGPPTSGRQSWRQLQ